MPGLLHFDAFSKFTNVVIVTTLIFLFVGMSVCGFVYAYVGAQGRPDKAARSPGAGGTGSCEAPGGSDVD